MDLLRDKALLARAATDPQAMESLMQDASSFVWHILHHHFAQVPCDRFIDMEDLYQTGMLGFIKAVRSYNPSHVACFTTYAGVVVMNEIRMALRRVPRVLREVVSLDVPVGPEEDVPLREVVMEYAATGDTEERVLARMAARAVMRTLRESDRRIVLLRVWLGLTQREIGMVVGMSQAAVSRVLLRVAREVQSA